MNFDWSSQNLTAVAAVLIYKILYDLWKILIDAFNQNLFISGSFYRDMEHRKALKKGFFILFTILLTEKQNFQKKET